MGITREIQPFSSFSWFTKEDVSRLPLASVIRASSQFAALCSTLAADSCRLGLWLLQGCNHQNVRNLQKKARTTQRNLKFESTRASNLSLISPIYANAYYLSNLFNLLALPDPSQHLPWLFWSPGLGLLKGLYENSNCLQTACRVLLQHLLRQYETMSWYVLIANLLVEFFKFLCILRPVWHLFLRKKKQCGIPTQITMKALLLTCGIWSIWMACSDILWSSSPWLQKLQSKLAKTRNFDQCQEAWETPSIWPFLLLP